MSRLFVSHSSKDNISAIAFKQWLVGSGWSDEDIFLDLDNIGAGERWKDALRKAHARCEAVILLASPEALASPECLTEVRKAEDFGKEIIVVLLRDLTVDDKRLDSYKERQIVDLSLPPQSHTEIVNYRAAQHQVTFNGEALAKVKEYLVRRGITAESFSWPPEGKPDAEPFPGLNAFTEHDAAIFFGRDADILAGLDQFRLLRRNATTRILAIQAASGAGKSSFLRAGLWPRLSRDPDFAPLAMLRPAHGILTGPEGLGHKLARHLSRPGAQVNPGEIYTRLMVDDAATATGAFLDLMKTAARLEFEQRRIGNANAAPPALIFAVDQAEELLAADNQGENHRFLTLIAALLREPPPDLEPFCILTVRADSAARLYQALADRNVEAPKILSLLPIPRTSYRDVIVKPIEVVARHGKKIAIAAALTEQLVADAAGVDALPLLAFTLFQLYRGFSAGGSITLENYNLLGGIAGSIKAAVKDALAKPEDAPKIPADGEQRLACLKATFIPWLARIDPATGQPARRTARLEELVGASRAMAQRLVEKRLLVADLRGGADIVEVAHESLLRQWPPLEAWLRTEADDLRIASAVESAASEWVRNGRAPTWLDHRGERLAAAEAVAAKEDYRRRLGPDGMDYLKACREREESLARARRQMTRLVQGSVAAAIVLIVGIAFAAYRSYKNQQEALRAQKEAEVSLLIGQAQTNLRANSVNIDRALDQAERAYRMVPSTASRSALLQVLLEISPHIKAAFPIDATAQALAWTGAEQLNAATAARMLTFDVGKPQQRATVSELPRFERVQEGNRAVISILAPIGAGQMIAVFNEGSIWRFDGGTGNVKAAKGEVSIGPLPHAVSVARSGKLIAMATIDERVILYRCDWRAATPACTHEQLGDVHGGVVAINNNEDRIAVGDRAGQIRIYSLIGEPIAEAASFASAIVSLGWAPRGEWLAVGTLQGEVGVLDFAGGSTSIVVQQGFGPYPVTALQWSPQDVTLAFVCHGKTICIWRSRTEGNAPRTFKPAARFEGHSQTVTRLSFDPTGTSLASSAADGTVRIWTLAQNTDVSFELYADAALEISSVGTSPDGKWVAGGSANGTIELWDGANGNATTAVQPAKDSEVRAVDWNSKDVIAALHDNDTVSIVVPGTSQPPVNFPLEAHGGYHLAWADGDRMIAVPTGETGVLLFDTNNLPAKPVRLSRTDGYDEAWGVVSIRGERSLVVSYPGGAIRIWDVSSNRDTSVQPADLGPSDKIAVGSMSVSPDRRLLATSSGGHLVPIYDLAKRAPWRVLKTESPEISTVAFSPTRDKLAALGSDGWLYVWTIDKDQVELYLALPVIPRRTIVGNAGSRSDHALWFDWSSGDCIVIASGIAALGGLCTDPDRWRSRFNALALGFGGSLN